MTRREKKNRPGRSSKWIRRDKRIAIYLRDGFSCVYCGADLSIEDPKGMGLDHVIPQSKRGCTHHESNLVTACLSCNSGRGNTPIEQFATPTILRRVRRQTRKPLNRELAKALLSGDVAWADVI